MWQLFLTSWAYPSLWLGEFSNTYQLSHWRSRGFGRKILMDLKMLYGHVQRIMAQCSIASSITQGPLVGPVLFHVFITDVAVLPAFSAGLLAAPSWVVLLVGLREEIPPRGTLAGLRSEPMWTTWSSRRPHARSCSCLRAIHNISTIWGVKEPCWEELREHDGWQILHESAKCTCSPESQLYPWLHHKKCSPAGQARWFYPSTLLSWYSTWRAMRVRAT